MTARSTDRPHWMRPIRDGELEALAELAKADGHEVIAPTHIFEKGAAWIGYASIAAVPLVLPWFHTQLCRPADSLYFINQMENHVANLLPPGRDWMCVPVVKESPFEKHIESLGYVKAGPATVTFRKVK